MTGAVMPDWLAHRAMALPNGMALITPGMSVTYAELDERVRGFAGGLADLGVRAGDCVALLAGNSLDFAVAVHGVSRAGAVLVPLNTRLTPSELATQLRGVEPAAMLADDAYMDRAKEAAALAGVAAPVHLALNGDLAEAELHDTHASDDPFCIIHTSGTTGRPRGAVLTYGNFWASAAGSAFNLGVSPDDRWLACMPLFHVGGLSILLRSAIAGTTVIIHPGFDPAAVANAIHDQRVTLVSVVATMLQRVLDTDPRDAPSSLRVVLVGGGPVPPPLLERAMQRGFPVIQTYGLTESASQVATLAPADAARRLGSAGMPLITTRIRIDAPPGEAGEILVAGPVVMQGYFKNPEATARVLRDDWLHTGDIGRLDADGFLYMLDRRDDLIVSGGENVYPAEVEAALQSHPAVEFAAVVGLPDERWGHLVAAAVVLRPGETIAGLEAHLRERLAGYKVPRRIVPVPELPTTANGKIQRHLVRKLLAESPGQAARGGPVA